MNPKCIPLALALSWGFGHIFLTAYWTSPDQQPTLKSTDSNSNHKTSFSCYDLLPQLKTSFPWVTRLHLWNTFCCSIFPGTRSGSFSQSAFLLSPSLFLLLVFLYRRWLCLTLEIMVASCPPPPRHPEHYDQVSGAVLLKWKCNCVTPNNQTYSVSSWPTGEIFKLLDRTFKEVFSFWLLLVFFSRISLNLSFLVNLKLPFPRAILSDYCIPLSISVPFGLTVTAACVAVPLSLSSSCVALLKYHFFQQTSFILIFSPCRTATLSL